jgi:hypothetical protein
MPGESSTRTAFLIARWAAHSGAVARVSVTQHPIRFAAPAVSPLPLPCGFGKFAKSSHQFNSVKTP